MHKVRYSLEGSVYNTSYKNMHTVKESEHEYIWKYLRSSIIERTFTGVTVPIKDTINGFR